MSGFFTRCPVILRVLTRGHGRLLLTCGQIFALNQINLWQVDLASVLDWARPLDNFRILGMIAFFLTGIEDFRRLFLMLMKMILNNLAMFPCSDSSCTQMRYNYNESEGKDVLKWICDLKRIWISSYWRVFCLIRICCGLLVYFLSGLTLIMNFWSSFL